MATTAFKGSPVQTSGDLPQVGAKTPEFSLCGTDLSDVSAASFAGKKIILNIFPSVDTGVCAASVRTFNKEAAELSDAVVLNVSADLPFGMARFCGAEGLEDVHNASSFRSEFGDDFGVTMTDGPLRGLLARSVVVVDAEGTVLHSELVADITQEPNYEAALGAVR